MIATTRNLSDPLPCPEPSRLLDYLKGSQDREIFDDTGRHLAECSKCRDRATELTAEDSFASRFRISGDDDFLAEPDMAAALFSAAMPRQGSDGWSAVLPPVDAIGPYELVRPLGRGGMGAVYLARHRHLDRICAIKLLPHRAGRDEDARGRFQREMKALASVDHPNIVAATDGGSEGDWFYLVMQYIDGVDLDQVLSRRETISIASACSIGVSLCSALAELHDAGLVHRDIKPSNVMLTQDATVKLLDFGLATPDASLCGDHERFTTVGDIVGTLAYASPEQLAGHPTDARSDLYSLGATLFRMIAGHPPHQRTAGEGVAAMLIAKAGEDAPMLVSENETVPEPLCDLVSRLLSRDPEDRPSHADDMRRVLDPLADVSGLRDLSMATAPRPEVARRPEVALRSREVAFDRPIDPPSRSWFRWVAGSAAAFVLAGFLFQWTTDRGTLVVRSDHDDINVRVETVDDGKPVRSFTMSRGQEQTTLASGRYRIHFDGPVDSVEFTPVEVTIGPDAVAVASARSPVSTVESRWDPKLDATFKGKKVREYIDQLERELDVEELSNAIASILRVMQPEDVDLARKVFLPTRRYGGMVAGGDNPSGRFMDRFHEQIKLMPQPAGLEAVIHEFENGNLRSQSAAAWAVLQWNEVWKVSDPQLVGRWFEGACDFLRKNVSTNGDVDETTSPDSRTRQPCVSMVRDLAYQYANNQGLDVETIPGLRWHFESQLALLTPLPDDFWIQLEKGEKAAKTWREDQGDFQWNADISLVSAFYTQGQFSVGEMLDAQSMGLSVPPRVVVSYVMNWGIYDDSTQQRLQQWFRNLPVDAKQMAADALVAYASRHVAMFPMSAKEQDRLGTNGWAPAFSYNLIRKDKSTGVTFKTDKGQNLVGHETWSPLLESIARQTHYPAMLSQVLRQMLESATPEIFAQKRVDSGSWGGGGMGGGGMGGGGGIFGGGIVESLNGSVTKADRKACAMLRERIVTAQQVLAPQLVATKKEMP